MGKSDSEEMRKKKGRREGKWEKRRREKRREGKAKNRDDKTPIAYLLSLSLYTTNYQKKVWQTILLISD